MLAELKKALGVVGSGIPERSELQPKSATGLAVAALGIVVLAFYHRLWLPDLVLIKRDAFRFFLPLKQYVVERLLAGELPQWFPYEALGRPFIAVPVTGVFHPFTALYFALAPHDAYRVATLLTCLVAAFGAFVLGRSLGFTRGGALLAGIVFACSGYVVSLTENLVYLYSTCLLPFFCVTLEKALVKGSAWLVAPPILWATVFLNGDVQTGYYYGFIALLWAAMRAPHSYSEAGLRVVLISVLAGLLAGVQLGPAAAEFAGSQRSQPGLFHDQALYWSTHPLRLVTILASPVGGDADRVAISHLFYGSHSTGGLPSGLWAESLYLGVPVTGLAVIGIWRRRDLRVLGLIGGFALLLSLGRFGGLYELFYQVVPFWSAFRYPEKLMGLFSFALAMLAGAGLDVLRGGHGRAFPWLVAAGLCAGIGLGLGTDATSTWTASNLGTPAGVTQTVTGSAGVAFLFSAVATMVVGLLITGVRHGWPREQVLVLLLVAVVSLDLSRANLDAYHTGPVEAATFTPGLVEAIRTHARVSGPGHFRIATIRENEFVSKEPIGRWLSGLGISSVMARQALDVEHNAQFHIESVVVYLPGLDNRFTSLHGQSFGTEMSARYNVAYIIGRSFHFQHRRFERGLVAFIDDYDLALVKNPMPMKPRVYLSRRPERATSSVELAALLERPDFLNGEVDLIETSEAILPGPAIAGIAEIERYAPEEVVVRVETPQSAVLILLDSFDAGWEARLEDGRELPIKRANGLVRAVVVPAGAHVVTFTYQTPLLRAGAGASLTGVVLCLGIIAHARWRRRGSLGTS